MSNHWHPTRKEAYHASTLVTQGKCAAQIAEELFGDSRTTHLMRVQTLLAFAHKNGILSLRPDTQKDASDKLHVLYGEQVTFHVVNNDHVLNNQNPVVDEEFRSDALCQYAARVIAERIHRLLLQGKDKQKPIVVANAGGLAISKIVRFLAGEKLVPDEPATRDLLFLSLNSAAIPNAYGLSSNTLAVRMAEIYGARHIAITHTWPADIKKEYERAVRDIDLLICGAGTQQGMLFKWLDSQVNIGLPRKAVGDICLIPISAEGEPLQPEMTGPEQIQRNLSPCPTYTNLKTLAAKDGVIYVAVGYQTDDRSRKQTAGTTRRHSKLAVTRAILDGGLARTCILGATLAEDLLATAPAG